MINEYEEQAEKFLSDTGTTFVAKLLTDQANFPKDKPDWKRYKWMVTFNRAYKMETFEFIGPVWNTNPKSKTTILRVYDVISCLAKSVVGTFSEFCFDYGYDDDSRKALETYLACQDEFTKVKNLWGDVLEQLREIQ